MVANNEHLLNAINEKDIQVLSGKGFDPQDDTKVYVMHGYLNRVRVQYNNNRHIMNNLD